jgi:hypothetical protein
MILSSGGWKISIKKRLVLALLAFAIIPIISVRKMRKTLDSKQPVGSGA